MQTKKQKVLQPSDIIKKLKIKDSDDVREAMDFAYQSLNYLNVGDSIEVSNNVKFVKIAADLLFLDTTLDKEEMVDVLERTKTIRIPL